MLWYDVHGDAFTMTAPGSLHTAADKYSKLGKVAGPGNTTGFYLY